MEGTFSIIGRCERTGMFGIAIATSEMAVGSRCIHVAPNVGALVTQASTNPRLGHLGLNLLRTGYSAPRVVEEIGASDQLVEKRQLSCLDPTGLSAARTGKENKPWAGHRVAPNVVVTADDHSQVGVRSMQLLEQPLDPVLVVRADVAADRLARYPDGDLIARVAGVGGRAEPAPEVVVRNFSPEPLENLVPDGHVAFGPVKKQADKSTTKTTRPQRRPFSLWSLSASWFSTAPRV